MQSLFEYDMDSDDEWEEPVEGEELDGEDAEELEGDKDEAGEEEEDDGFMVPDGYVSGEEGGDGKKRPLEGGATQPRRKRAHVFEKLSWTGVEFDSSRIERGLVGEDPSCAMLRSLAVHRAIVFGQKPIKAASTHTLADDHWCSRVCSLNFALNHLI